MDAERKKSIYFTKKRVLVIGLFLLLYFLSIGPVLWLGFHGLGPSLSLSMIEKVYWPLWFAKDNFPFAARLIDGYIALWVTVFMVAEPPPPDFPSDVKVEKTNMQDPATL